MACPLFVPSSSPGDLRGGHCAADPSVVIDPETLRRYCHFGYARGQCDRAAKSDDDAIRLMVKSARGRVVEIAWAIERNHHPVAVGAVDINTDAAPTAGDALTMQLCAFAADYARYSRTPLTQ